MFDRDPSSLHIEPTHVRFFCVRGNFPRFKKSQGLRCPGGAAIAGMSQMELHDPVRIDHRPQHPSQTSILELNILHYGAHWERRADLLPGLPCVSRIEQVLVKQNPA